MLISFSCRTAAVWISCKQETTIISTPCFASCSLVLSGWTMSIACHDFIQDTGIFFIALEELGHNIYALLLMHTNFDTPSHHVLWLVQINSWCPQLPPLLTWFKSQDQGIHPLEVLFHAWCWWATRLALVHYTCSFCCKVFCTLLHFTLIHGACFTLCQYPVMDFCDLLCLQKVHYGMFPWQCNCWCCIHTSDLVDLCNSTERWNVAYSYPSIHVVMMDTSALLWCSYHAISKLPLLFDFPW